MRNSFSYILYNEVVFINIAINHRFRLHFLHFLSRMKFHNKRYHAYHKPQPTYADSYDFRYTHTPLTIYQTLYHLVNGFDGFAEFKFDIF